MRIPLLTMIVLCLSGILAAQDPPDIAAGTSPSATYHTDFDSVDMATGRLNLRIPLVEDHSQRGNLNFTYSLYYTSAGQWNEYCYQSEPGNEICDFRLPSRIGGVGFVTDGMLTSRTERYNEGGGIYYTTDEAVEADGGFHDLGTVQTTPTLVEESIDGSGIRATPGPSVGSYLTNKNGVQFGISSFNPSPWTEVTFAEDANGNQLTTTTTVVCPRTLRSGSYDV